jgi:hypothetical protein
VLFSSRKGKRIPLLREFGEFTETYLFWNYNPECNSNIGRNEMTDVSAQEINKEIGSFSNKICDFSNNFNRFI